MPVHKNNALRVMKIQINAVKEAAACAVQKANPSLEVYGWCPQGFLTLVKERDDECTSAQHVLLEWRDPRVQFLFELERELFFAASELASIESTHEKIGMVFSKPRPSVIAWVHRSIERASGLEGFQIEFVPNAVRYHFKNTISIEVHRRGPWLQRAREHHSDAFVQLLALLLDEAGNVKHDALCCPFTAEQCANAAQNDNIVMSTPRVSGGSHSDDGDDEAASNAYFEASDVHFNFEQSQNQERRTQPQFELPAQPPRKELLKACVPPASFWQSDPVWIERVVTCALYHLGTHGYFAVTEVEAREFENKVHMLAEVFTHDKGYTVLPRAPSIIITKK